MDAAQADEMIAPPAGGRAFELPVRPGLADCAPSGRIRLDGLARWLQDVAYADVEDAGLQDAAIWVLRRCRMRVERFPRFADCCTARTFCSGLGRMWAERRTTIAGAGAATPQVEAVALWVHLDPETRRPFPLTDSELSVYGALGHDRRVSARLRHPAPDLLESERAWTFRATDCDLADHVNNAAYWQPLEEELLSGGPEPTSIDVEVEFRAPAQPGIKLVTGRGAWRWIQDEHGELHASIRVNSSSNA